MVYVYLRLKTLLTITSAEKAFLFQTLTPLCCLGLMQFSPIEFPKAFGHFDQCSVVVKSCQITKLNT